MKVCPVCGETMFDDWSDCPACGHPYPDDDSCAEADRDDGDRRRGRRRGRGHFDGIEPPAVAGSAGR